MKFGAKDNISTGGWQLEHIAAFTRVSIVCFSLLSDDAENLGQKVYKSFKQASVLLFCLVSTLFSDDFCDAELVDNYVRLFLSSALEFGQLSARKNNNDKGGDRKDGSQPVAPPKKKQKKAGKRNYNNDKGGDRKDGSQQDERQPVVSKKKAEEGRKGMLF